MHMYVCMEIFMIYGYIYIQTNANAQVGLRCNDCLGCRVVVLGLEI